MLRCDQFVDGNAAWHFQVHNMNSALRRRLLLNSADCHFAFQVAFGKEVLWEGKSLWCKKGQVHVGIDTGEGCWKLFMYIIYALYYLITVIFANVL